MCVFCDIRDGRLNSLKVETHLDCFIVLDKFPLSPGHLLIVSKDHCEFFSDIADNQRRNIMELASYISKTMKKNNPKIVGFNFLINDGKFSGQHIPHFHLHVIPRYRYDRLNVLFRLVSSRLNPLNYLSASKAKYEWMEEVSHLVEHFTLSSDTKCN